MASTYRSLISADTQQIFYVNDSITYPFPAFSNTSILGPVFSSGIYAKSLDKLEIGSSGSIAIALLDKYTLQVTKQANSSNTPTIIQGVDGCPISIQANDTFNTIIIGGLRCFTQNNTNIVRSDVPVTITNNLTVQGSLSCNELKALGTNIIMSATVQMPSISNVRVVDNVIRMQDNNATLKWTPTPSGTPQTQDSNPNNDSYWSLSGGHLRIKGTTSEYGFRINNFGEFELFKVVNGEISVVTKFGGVYLNTTSN